jgi:cytochrome c biogenesis protein CcmG, thiol:disulfide interchange protein DsbE
MTAARVVCGVLLAAVIAAHDPAYAAEKFKSFKLKTVEGDERSLSDVLGKATLVVFFFPTCPYCNAAFPEIQKIHDEYREHGLSVVWINAVPQENRLIPAWRATHGYTVPILLGTESVQRDYQLTATPTHFLLDSTGRTIVKRAGYRKGDGQSLTRQIRQALGLVP